MSGIPNALLHVYRALLWSFMYSTSSKTGLQIKVMDPYITESIRPKRINRDTNPEGHV